MLLNDSCRLGGPVPALAVGIFESFGIFIKALVNSELKGTA